MTVWGLHQQDPVSAAYLSLPQLASPPGPHLRQSLGCGADCSRLGWQSVTFVPALHALVTSPVGLFPSRQGCTQQEQWSPLPCTCPGALAQAWTWSRFSVNVCPAQPPPTLFHLTP